MVRAVGSYCKMYSMQGKKSEKASKSTFCRKMARHLAWVRYWITRSKLLFPFYFSSSFVPEEWVYSKFLVMEIRTSVSAGHCQVTYREQLFSPSFCHTLMTQQYRIRVTWSVQTAPRHCCRMCCVWYELWEKNSISVHGPGAGTGSGWVFKTSVLWPVEVGHALKRAEKPKSLCKLERIGHLWHLSHDKHQS